MKRVQIFVSIAMALALPVACYQSSDAMREQPYAEQDGGKAERDSKQDAQAQPVLDRIQVSGSRVARAEEEKQNADAASSTTLHRDDTGNQQLASEPAPAPKSFRHLARSAAFTVPLPSKSPGLPPGVLAA